MDINQLIKQVSEQQLSLIEEKIKELIKPYINTNYYDAVAIKGDLERKGYKMDCITSNDFTEYRITYMPTGRCDCFIVKNKIDLENLKTIALISDITRGIEV